MSPRARAADVSVSDVVYAPVGDRRDSTIEDESEYIDQESIPDLFRYYIEEVVTKGDISTVDHGVFGSESEMQQLLDECLEANIDSQRFTEIVIDLGKRLNDQMPAAANQGVLFIARATVSGGNIGGDSRDIVSLLKLDTEEDQRLVLSREGIEAVDESNAFPPHDQLQKGAVYPTEGIPPTELSGDIKIFQSSDSNYFEQFFQYSSTVPSSIEQGRTVLDLVDRIVDQKLSRDISSRDISEIVEESEQNEGIIDNDVLKNSLSDITGEQYSDEDVDEILSREGISRLYVRQDKIPQVFKRTIYTDAGEVSIKHHSAADDNIEVSQTDDGILVEISGQDHIREFIEK